MVPLEFCVLVSAFLSLSPVVGADTMFPADGMIQGGKFSINQVPVQRSTPLSAARSLRRTYLKYGLQVPADIDEAASIDQEPLQLTESVSAQSKKSDVEYVIKVQIGGQNLTLDLDTGSYDLWVKSTLMAGDQRMTAKLYSPKDSGAKLMERTSFQIAYGDTSSADGAVYEDRVAIGSIVVPKQAVGAARKVSRELMRDTAIDGIFGFPSTDLKSTIHPKQPSWFQNIRPKLAAPVFTASLKRHAAGSYDFGYVDKEKYTGDIVWTNVTGKRSFWDFTTTGFAIGDERVQSTSFSAIADTGSSLWYLPVPVANAYWAKVPGASYRDDLKLYAFPCRSECQLPDMTVIISGKRVTVPGINMSYSKTPTPGLCAGGISQWSPPPGTAPFGALFGDVFLKGLFVVHEWPIQGQSRIGFAAQAPTSQEKSRQCDNL